MPDPMSSLDPQSPMPQPLLIASAMGACPRCGASTLFAGPVRFAASCRSCGLEYGQFNVGDGPAAFLTLIIGALMVAMALMLELKVHPPLWLHILLWTPLTVLAVIGSLRVAKGALLILEYRNKAREGRLTAGDREA
ncbi:hypothetical protein A0J57_10800 [Sphingobium sp. 22B]|uniref:DUF983 domain-containing protein n=1 Tax=unclassified Sphingobium TaxID=2611147 RepID=UPI000785626A|nr:MULTISPECIES: DUF983 domain-containing protein [unclassified Sphingobium]KXU30288.1 hypothetical protein AXW74_18430 [Sphingobium sp. AM]KYC32405.1 hypothetical protein A0J57_10800 [Sphingobium sp. 22B]OAP32034.1 hypothetical protein A8O16_10590 [Sphingobium sp. 20006FA]